MALQLDYTFNGVKAKGAVARVLFVNGGGKADKTWSGQIGVYADAKAASPFFTFNISAPYADGEHPYTALYNAAKGKDDFKDAKDI